MGTHWLEHDCIDRQLLSSFSIWPYLFIQYTAIIKNLHLNIQSTAYIFLYMLVILATAYIVAAIKIF